MWKVFVGFIAFALVALFVIMQAGDKIDMQGEAGHGIPTNTIEAEPETLPSTVPPAPSTVPSSPASVPPTPATAAPVPSVTEPVAAEPAAAK